MDNENPTTRRFDTNEGTQALTTTGPHGPPPLAPRAAFIAAHARLADLAEAASGPALAVVAVDGRARVVDATLVPDRQALVVGRHTSCGLRLHGSAVALRQLALLARTEGDRVHAHVWDLNTELPFSVEDGASTSALVADGPLYLSVSEYSLWVVPVTLLTALPGQARPAWDALPPRQFVDRRSPRRPPAAGRWPPARSTARPQPGAPLTEPSQVTLRGATLMLQDADDVEIGWGVLRLSDGVHRVQHRISAERLEHGVLVGRYERCGLTIEGIDRVSRVHLLLVRIGDELWAIDAASTNGVRRGPRPVSAVTLAAEDELLLADTLSLQWIREAHPEA